MLRKPTKPKNKCPNNGPKMARPQKVGTEREREENLNRKKTIKCDLNGRELGNNLPKGAFKSHFFFFIILV